MRRQGFDRTSFGSEARIHHYPYGYGAVGLTSGGRDGFTSGGYRRGSAGSTASD